MYRKRALPFPLPYTKSTVPERRSCRRGMTGRSRSPGRRMRGEVVTDLRETGIGRGGGGGVGIRFIDVDREVQGRIDRFVKSALDRTHRRETGSSGQLQLNPPPAPEGDSSPLTGSVPWPCPQQPEGYRISSTRSNLVRFRTSPSGVTATTSSILIPPTLRS